MTVHTSAGMRFLGSLGLFVRVTVPSNGQIAHFTQNLILIWRDTDESLCDAWSFRETGIDRRAVDFHRGLVRVLILWGGLRHGITSNVTTIRREGTRISSTAFPEGTWWTSNTPQESVAVVTHCSP